MRLILTFLFVLSNFLAVAQLRIKHGTPIAAPRDTVHAFLLGGASGGAFFVSGGGAGGEVKPMLAFNITRGITYSGVIGVGGAGSNNGTPYVGAGGNTTFTDGVTTYTAYGGGKPGDFGPVGYIDPTSGGNGGGGGSSGGSNSVGAVGGSGVLVHTGGNGTAAPYAGGGGASSFENGHNADPTSGGNGGNGYPEDITGSTVYYGAGGGGGGYTPSGTSAGLAGLGGTGNSHIGAPGDAGTSNMGDGGGSGGDNSAGGAGGSGVVMFRFPTAAYSSVTVTGTYTSTTIGSETLIKITSGSYTITWI